MNTLKKEINPFLKNESVKDAFFVNVLSFTDFLSSRPLDDKYSKESVDKWHSLVKQSLLDLIKNIKTNQSQPYLEYASAWECIIEDLDYMHKNNKTQSEKELNQKLINHIKEIIK